MKNTIIITFTVITLLLPCGQIDATTFLVGPSRPYTNLQAVSPLLQPGDVVEVDGNHTYPGDVIFTHPGTANGWITIRGLRVNGQRPIISGGVNTVTFSTPSPYSGPGADYYLFEGFEITGGSSRGLFHQAAFLHVRDTVVRNCPAHGILGADDGSGTLILEHVEVYACGNGSSQHQIYMATDEANRPGSVFRMQFCYIHDGNGGNNVKSRAERNEIYYNWIEGAYYHELELIGPDGGDPLLKREDSDVVGNVLWKRNTFHMTRVGGDGTGETFGRYRFVNNTFICGTSSAFRIFDGIESIEMHNNVFYRVSGDCTIVRTAEAVWGPAGEQISGSFNWVKSGALSVPSPWTDTLTGTDPLFIDIGVNNLTPAPGSPLIDAGTMAPASAAGFDFPRPMFPPEYIPPRHTTGRPGHETVRPVDFRIDLGAYEAGQLWFVDIDNQTGSSDGTRLMPFTSIQTGIDAANAGDTVFVARGTYPENCVISGKKLRLMGGFPGGTPSDYNSGTDGNFSVQHPQLYPTRIGALSANPAVLLIYTAASGSTIDAFHITGGNHGIVTDVSVTWPHVSNLLISRNLIEQNGVTGDTAHRGGGLWLQGTGFIVTDNTIRANRSGRGAGISANTDGMILRGNIIEDNVGYDDHGGGLYLAGSQTISHNIVRYNKTGEGLGYGWGGGILILGVATLSGNIIHHNHAPSIGGGVFVDEGGTALLRNDLIYNNTTAAHDKGGAGIYVDGGAAPSHATITNCTIAYNSAPGSTGGNGIYIEGNSSADILNCIFWGNANDDFYVQSGSMVTVSYSASQEFWSGPGNIQQDPQFADAGAGDFHLKSQAGRWHPVSGAWVIDTVHSPAIDAGHPASACTHEPTPNGGRVNMGVFGNTAEASKSSSVQPVPAISWPVLPCILLVFSCLLLGRPRKRLRYNSRTLE